MADLTDEVRPPDGGLADRSAVAAREGGRYVVAVLGYIALGWMTKGFLSFTYGLLYFVLVLDVLPRVARYFRSRRAQFDESRFEVVDE